MSLLEDVANRVAAQTLELIEATGDEELEKKVAGEIGASSPTLQEAFTTALRILKAEARAQRFIEKVQNGASVAPKSEAEPAPAPAPEAEAAPEPATTPEPEPAPEPAVEDVPELMAVEMSEDDAADEDESEVIALPSPRRATSRRVTRLPKL